MRKGRANVSVREGNTLTSTYLLFAAGVLLGAVGSLVFILRSRALLEEEPGDDAHPDRLRQLAVRLTLVTYAVLAFILLVIAVVLGDIASIITGGILVVFASAGIVFLWSAAPS